MSYSHLQKKKGKPREGQDLPKITQQGDSKNRTPLFCLPAQRLRQLLSSTPSPLYTLVCKTCLPGKLWVYPRLCLCPSAAFHSH